MVKIDFEPRFDCRQGSVGCIEQGVCVEIIHKSEPFPLEDAPKSLGNIKMWAIRREKDKEQPSLLPYGTKFPHKPAPMYTYVVKDYKGSFADTERHTVKKVSDLICGHVLCRSESLISIPAVYHTEYSEPETSFREDVDIFTAELPSVWHISIRSNMTLVTIVKVYETVLFLLYEFLQLLSLVRIELRRGSPLGTFPYTSISPPMRIKKPGRYFRSISCRKPAAKLPSLSSRSACHFRWRCVPHPRQNCPLSASYPARDVYPAP